jgi:4-hydroxybenzoate polyprenyltransferase
MLSRWWIYLKEMYQPSSRLLFSALMTYLTWKLWPGPKQDLSWISLTASALTYALMILYYRICDEFKDLETDRRFFPDRPVPSGRVSLRDLFFLRHTVSALAFLLQVFVPYAFLPFLIFWLFSWGMGRWFFMPRLLSENRLLAFLTHSPVGFIGGFYLLAAMVRDHGPLLSSASLALVAVLNMPGLAWEILRKTRSPLAEQEGYQTYSQILGTGCALFIAGLFITTTMILSVMVAPTWELPEWTMKAMLILHLLFLVLLPTIYVRLKKQTINLRPLGDIYNGSLLLIFLVASLW